MKYRAMFAAAGALVVVGGFFAVSKINAMAMTGAGYSAKIACSEVFLAGRDPEAVRAVDLKDISPVLENLTLEIDPEKRDVRAHLFGFGASRAVYRDGYGCTLARGGEPADLPPLSPVASQDLPFAGDSEIAAILQEALKDEAAGHRAFVVLVNGNVAGEAYTDGFGPQTPMLSWSMAKSITATMVGLAARQGLINTQEVAPVPEWRKEKDPRRSITWNNLLQMQSGLEFVEDYVDPVSDVNRMLFAARQMGSVTVKKKLAHQPGEHFYYSSGTTNLLQRTLQQVLSDSGVDYHAFARNALFEPLGAASAVFEPDSAGVFVGSSYLYASARDWAKLGQLYLNDGVWDGERLLPEGWATYAATPATASDKFYGAQFWLNHPGKERVKFIPGLPDEAYAMAGHEGQYVIIVPDKNMVIVRLGLTRGREPMPVVAPTLAKIYEAVE